MLKKGVHLLARAAVRYQVVEAYREEYPVSVLCDTLGVSLSGYYTWKKRPVSKHRQEDSQLTEYIPEAYRVGRKVSGSPRIRAELRARGVSCSRKQVARLMKDQGLSACRPHHRTVTTQSEPGARVAPNVLDQDFTASHPNEKWTGDITAVWTIRVMALACRGVGSVFTTCDRMGDGGDPRRIADREGEAVGSA